MGRWRSKLEVRNTWKVLVKVDLRVASRASKRVDPKVASKVV